jgi:hypothetical protein
LGGVAWHNAPVIEHKTAKTAQRFHMAV